MSALAGFWSNAGRSAVQECLAMLAEQQAYGPDRTASLEFGPVTLGRNLFKLLPEDDWDRQPVTGGGGRFAMVADVRLDNREELASALGLSAAHLRSAADSAILLKAFERWGETAPEHLLGDFAFALFDRREHHLLLARDPLGQRPLFWHRGKDFIAFASMPRGLHALDGIERHANPEAVVSFLAHGRQPSAQSYFSGINRVQPGHVVRVTAYGESQRRYWAPERRALRLGRFEDYVDAYRHELDRAVRCRLRTRAAVVATHLSGGWDSGAVSATAARLESRPIAAFTAVPPRVGRYDAPRNRFADEGPAAAAVAAMHPNLEHHRIVSESASPLDRLDEGARWFERPLFNLCNHGWLAQIRQSAGQRGAQILLTGEIGNWTISAAPLGLLGEYLRGARWQAWWRAARGLQASRQARWRGILANSFGPWVPPSIWQRLAIFSSDPGVRPALRAKWLAAVKREESPPREDRFDTALTAFCEMDFGEYRKGILGGWGIDKRDPTADVRLIDFCLSLPIEMLLDDRGRRPLARAALADRLPAQVLEEPRKGYQAADWHAALGQDIRRATALVDAIAQDPEAARLIDSDRLRMLLRDWPQGGWSAPGSIGLYRNILLQALTAGHFMIHANRPVTRLDSGLSAARFR